jgi:arylsulfatase A-like enzyme
MTDVLLVGIDDVSRSEIDGFVTPRIQAFRETAYEPRTFSHPQCSQSRQAILFGSYGKKIGTWRDIGTTVPTSITPPIGLRTLPGVLRAAGFQTALVGKWHCGPCPDGTVWPLAPFQRGYDEWIAGTRLNLASPPSIDYRHWQRVDADAAGHLVQDVTEYATLAQLEAAEAWWPDHEGAPRFLHVAFNAPHGPWHTNIPEELLMGWPEPGTTAPRREKFRAMLRSADTAFGRLLDLVGPSCPVFLYSDNGTAAAVADPSVDPLHAKATTFDPGIEVIGLGRWGNCPAGEHSELQHLVDHAAGVCAAAGVAPAAEWDSKTTGRVYILSEAEDSDGLDRCCRTSIMKLRQVAPAGQASYEELYDLEDDPLETTPLDLDDPANADALAWLREKLAEAAI